MQHDACSCPLACRRDPWWLLGLLAVLAFSLGVLTVVGHDQLEREIRERGLFEPQGFYGPRETPERAR
jgi:hypothetical protein